MKRALLILVLLLAWAPRAAFAHYDARKSEVVSELEKATVTDEERAKLKSAVETYFGGREDCFEILLAVVAKTDEQAQQATFRDQVGVCSVGANQVLGRALDGISTPTVGALGFLTVLATNEAAFYQSLGAVTVADARDQIVLIRLHLAQMTEALDEKWKTILDEDETLDQRAKTMTGELRDDFEAVLRQVADANPDAAEVIADGVKKWVENEGSPSPSTGNAIIDGIITGVTAVLGPVIGTWQVTNTRAEARVRAYRTLFTSERRVLVMFKEVRGDVKKFLEENDFPKADAAYAAAKSSLDTFASSGKSSGQSSDASELRGDLMQQLAIHLKQAADVYAKFVDRHKEKFFGALGTSTKRDLVEHAEWEQYATYVDGYGLDAKVRDWQTKSTNYFDVDLSRLSSDARDNLKSGLRAILDSLVKELEVAGKSYRDVKTVIEDERDDVEEELD